MDFFLISSLHEHKCCKKSLFNYLVKKKHGTILKNVFLNILEYTKCFCYSFQVMLAFDLKVRKLNKDKSKIHFRKKCIWLKTTFCESLLTRKLPFSLICKYMDKCTFIWKEILDSETEISLKPSKIMCGDTHSLEGIPKKSVSRCHMKAIC